MVRSGPVSSGSETMETTHACGEPTPVQGSYDRDGDKHRQTENGRGVLQEKEAQSLAQGHLMVTARLDPRDVCYGLCLLGCFIAIFLEPCPSLDYVR